VLHVRQGRCLGGAAAIDQEKSRNHATRMEPKPAQAAITPGKPVTIGELVGKGKLLEVHCALCRPTRHFYLNPKSLVCQNA
jgi:hypothetical protein